MNPRPSIRAHPARVCTLPAPPGARDMPAAVPAALPTAAFGERAVPVLPTAPYPRRFW